MAGSVKIIGGSKNQTLDLKIAQFVLTTTTLLTVDLERDHIFGFWFQARGGLGLSKILALSPSGF